MFLLPSILVGVVLAAVLGGRPSRVLELRFRHSWTVFAALALQAALVTPLRGALAEAVVSALHLGSYAFLLAFAAVNVRRLVLLPLFLGLFANALVIAANGGHMPVSQDAWEAAGFDAVGPTSNVRLGADHLGFLGDVFAIPRPFPLGNVFSVGDILIGVGMIALIVAVSVDGSRRALEPARLLRPLRSGSFRRLAAGKLVSHLGDWLTLAALVGWVYDESGSTAEVALLLAVRLAPPILGGGLAAALVDRLRKERLLVWIEVGRGAAVSVALAGVLVGSRPAAFAAVAVSGALAAISSATVPALVPSLLDDELLPAANASLGIAQDGAMAIGALGAGIALSASTAAVALVVDLVTFAAAAALFWTIRARPQPIGREPSEEGVRAGLRYLLGRRTLLVVVMAFGAATLATGLTNATLPRFLDGELGLGPGAYGFGLSALAWGLAVGQAAVGFTRVGAGGGRWIGAALLVMAGLFFTLASTTHAPTAILLLALIGLVDGTTDVLFDTIVQREADPAYYGRVFGFAAAFMTTTMMGAVAVAPVLNGIGPPHSVILFGALFLVAASAVALVGSRRSPAAAPLPARVGSP
jgi:Family of unknown function (DUF5317)/Major Facilitator Superfamily